VRRFVLAFVVVLLAAVPAAEAKRVKCVRSGASKSCRMLPARPPSPHVSMQMTGTDLFGSAAAPVPVPAPTPAPQPPPSPAPTPTQAPTRLGVVAREWSLTLSRTSLAAGPASVELQNFGEDAHNLRIERVDGAGAPLDIPLAEAGERQKASGTLTAGDYRIYCTLPGHDAQGMHARLTVSP
jgi:plastocyanin